MSLHTGADDVCEVVDDVVDDVLVIGVDVIDTVVTEFTCVHKPHVRLHDMVMKE